MMDYLPEAGRGSRSKLVHVSELNNTVAALIFLSNRLITALAYKEITHRLWCKAARYKAVDFRNEVDILLPDLVTS